MKILTCKIFFLFIIIFSAVNLYADTINVKAGVHDFMDAASRDFYKVAPSVMMSYVFFDEFICSLEVSTGISYISIDYNSRWHHFVMVPLTSSFVINFFNKTNFFVPFVGSGIGVYYKADKSPTARKTYHYVTYGYNFFMGFSFLIKEKIKFILEFRYHLCMTNDIEDIDLSGIMPSVGVGFMF